jgi:hypothetical protein
MPDEFVDLAPKPLRQIARILLNSYFKRMKYVCQNATGIIAVSKKYLEYGLLFAERSFSFNRRRFSL